MVEGQRLVGGAQGRDAHAAEAGLVQPFGVAVMVSEAHLLSLRAVIQVEHEPVVAQRLRCATSPRRPLVLAITCGVWSLVLPSRPPAYYNPPTAVEPESLTTFRPVDPDSAPESALDLFYQRPILNSPYVRPDRHWARARQGQSADQSHR